MQHEVLAVIALERINDLLVLAGAKRRDHHRLGLAAGEDGAAVDTRQKAGLSDDRAHRLGVAAVDPLAGIEDRVADDVLFQLLELACDQDVVGTLLAAELLQRLRLDLADHVLAGRFLRLGIGGCEGRLRAPT